MPALFTTASPQMKQLIVNADDLGLTESVGRGIIHAFERGIVTSATLLANGAAWQTAADVSRQLPRLGIGVHFNLSEGSPVSPPTSIQSLVDARGNLHLTPGRLWRKMAARQIPLLEVETELRAQLTRVLEAGIAPTHVDGHMHVHVVPVISEIVIRLAREFRIPAIRCPAESIGSILGLPRSLGDISAGLAQVRAAALAVSFFARNLKRNLDKAGLLYTEHFYGLSQAGFLDLPSILRILRRLSQGTTELMCHPGYLDADLASAGGRLVPEREVELQALTASAVVQLTQAEGIRLISYREFTIQHPVVSPWDSSQRPTTRA
jgi:chitin disaccharide deacetylase